MDALQEIRRVKKEAEHRILVFVWEEISGLVSKGINVKGIEFQFVEATTLADVDEMKEFVGVRIDCVKI